MSEFREAFVKRHKQEIAIKPSHEGLFTAKAHKAGKSVSEYASEEAHSSTASTATKKQAVFAENASHWHHGGKK